MREPVDRPGAEPSCAYLVAVLRRLAPASMEVGARRIDDADLAGLLAAEAPAVERAVPKRRREFATGRALLRELLGSDAPIVRGPTRAPELPPGARGSLAHDDIFAVAAVTRSATIAAVGIDIEPVAALEPEVAAIVLRPEEAGLDAHLAFALKEAAYKAWSGLGGRILDHHDVSLTVDVGRFSARVVDDGVTLDGRWAVVGDRWVALVVVPAGAAAPAS